MTDTSSAPHTGGAEGTAGADPAAAPAQWAVVELMGHQRIAGRISQQTYGGCQLVRVDVPEVTITERPWRNGGRAEVTRTIPPHTRSFGGPAIYSINWCDELAATVAAHNIKHELVNPYSLRTALDELPGPAAQRLLALGFGPSARDADDDTDPEGDDAHGF